MVAVQEISRSRAGDITFRAFGLLPKSVPSGTWSHMSLAGIDQMAQGRSAEIVEDIRTIPLYQRAHEIAVAHDSMRGVRVIRQGGEAIEISGTVWLNGFHLSFRAWRAVPPGRRLDFLANGIERGYLPLNQPTTEPEIKAESRKREGLTEQAMRWFRIVDEDTIKKAKIKWKDFPELCMGFLHNLSNYRTDWSPIKPIPLGGGEADHAAFYRDYDVSNSYLRMLYGAAVSMYCDRVEDPERWQKMLMKRNGR